MRNVGVNSGNHKIKSSCLLLKEKMKEWSFLHKSIVGVIIFVVVSSIYVVFGYMHIKSLIPPEGYVYPSAPILKGIYTLETSERHAKSRVGNVYINCITPGLGQLDHAAPSGNTATCCWLSELDGKNVIVERKYMLSSRSITWFLDEYYSPFVSKIILRDNGRVYYEKNDKVLRQEWIDQSFYQLFVGAVFISIFIVIISINYINKYL
jgi:hypothetical protein